MSEKHINKAPVSKAAAPKEPLVHITKRAFMSPFIAWGIRLIAFVLAMIVCGALAFLLMPKLQAKPEKIADFYQYFITGPFSSPYRIWRYLKDTAVLLSIALALTPAFRMRFWNVGGEGQTLIGVLSCIAVDFYLGGKIPEPLLLVLMLLAALLGGAIWGVIPAIFKARWNTNETLFTLMMNYVATCLVSFFLVVWVPNGSNSLGKLAHGKLPSFWNEYFVIILIAVITMVLLYFYLYHSKHGYEISVVGQSERTARYVGINVRKVIIRTMVLSGTLCGLSGFLIGSGLNQSVTTNSVNGLGFTAILVSWLAKFNPLAMVFTSGVIVMLNHGAEQISQKFNTDDSFPSVVVGIILFFIIGSEFFINYKLNFRKQHKMEETVK